MSGLHDAAAALLQEAPEPIVLTVIRLLLDARAPPAPARTVAASSPPTPRPSLPGRQPAPAGPQDPAWEALRGQVKAAMAERGADYAGLAAAIGRSEIAVRITINTRKPPKPIVRTRLQAWLDQAPAVASPAVPFPESGTGHRGNGHADGPYGHAGAA
jgi:hypothetical protein